jgi:hypothetical protein
VLLLFFPASMAVVLDVVKRTIEMNISVDEEED